MSAFFTIYAYDALKEQLDQIEHMDFLFGEPRFIRSLDPDKTEKKAFIIGADISHYSGLLTKAVESIAHTFKKRTAAEDGEFELITWLVIKE